MKNVNAMIEVLFNGAQIRRWNGFYKAEDFVETSKQGMNSVVSYLIAKMHEHSTGEKVNYQFLIELSICRMVYKAIFTDINPRISYRLLHGLKEETNAFAIKKAKELGFDENFCKSFEKYCEKKDDKMNLEMKIFHAASNLTTYWEFNQIKPGAGQNYLLMRTETEINKRLKHIKSLEAIKDFMLNQGLNDFVDLYANTAFIKRWARFEMNPQISDLTHMYMTAVLTYLFMCEGDLPSERCIEGFYAGLFHDTIEVLTGDIPHLLKKEIKGFKGRLNVIENEEYKKYIKPLLPSYLRDEMRIYILSKISDENKKIVKAADNVCAYAEVVTSVLTGTTNDYFIDLIEGDVEEYKEYEVEGIKINSVYENLYAKYSSHQKE